MFLGTLQMWPYRKSHHSDSLVNTDNFIIGSVVHAYNPSIWEVEVEDYELKDNPGFILSLKPAWREKLGLHTEISKTSKLLLCSPLSF